MREGHTPVEVHNTLCFGISQHCRFADVGSNGILHGPSRPLPSSHVRTHLRPRLDRFPVFGHRHAGGHGPLRERPGAGPGLGGHDSRRGARAIGMACHELGDPAASRWCQPRHCPGALRPGAAVPGRPRGRHAGHPLSEGTVRIDRHPLAGCGASPQPWRQPPGPDGLGAGHAMQGGRAAPAGHAGAGGCGHRATHRGEPGHPADEPTSAAAGLAHLPGVETGRLAGSPAAQPAPPACGAAGCGGAAVRWTGWHAVLARTTDRTQPGGGAATG